MTWWRWIGVLVWGVVAMTCALPACAHASAAPDPIAHCTSSAEGLAPSLGLVDELPPLEEAPGHGSTDSGLPEPSMAVGAAPPVGPNPVLHAWQRRPHDPAALGPFLEGPLRPPRLLA